MITDFQETDAGDLFIADGVNNVKRWDGLASAFEDVGLAAPSAALTISSPGTAGAIVGTYYAYERFLDAQANVSDLSPISAAYTAQGTSGTITGATNASPIVITSAAHGLPTGSTVKVSGVGGNTSANNTWVMTALTANTFSLDDSHGTDDYNGGGTWTSGVSSLSYSAVQVPSESKVTRRQILRNTDGQATTFYVDVDTTDLSATAFSSTRTDSNLAAQEAVPILDADQLPFANRHAKPLNYFPFLASCLGRMFATGNIEYNRGTVQVTFGSSTVTGVGTAWKSTLAGRYLYVETARKAVQISSVDETAQTLALIDPYTDTTDKFAAYSIKPPPAYRRVIQFTPAGLPQSWPAIYGLSLQETGDEITGVMQKGPYLYILEKSHIHKLTFSTSPILDGAVFMVASRGCVNNRCWISVDETAYMLDELGIHKFSGNSNVEHLSAPIQDLFRRDVSDGTPLRVNWQWSQYFHANIDRQRETIRWFVSLDGSRFPRHAICLQYRTSNWWVEEYPLAIGGTCNGYQNRVPQCYYGGEHRKVLAAWSGTTDLAPALNARSTATGATTFGLSDAAASFVSAALNAQLAIVQGTGKGQTRRIVAVSTTTLTIDAPWNILPDATSVYQIGGVHWLFRSSWLRLTPSEKMLSRRFEMLFEPLENPAVADLRFFSDFRSAPDEQARTQASAHGGGIASADKNSDLTIDLTKETGWVQRVFPYSKEYFIQGRTYTQYEIEGFSNADQIRLYQFLWEGMMANDGNG